MANTRNVRIWRTRGTRAFGAHEERAHLAHNDERAHLAHSRNMLTYTRSVSIYLVRLEYHDTWPSFHIYQIRLVAHEKHAPRRNVRIWRTRGTCAFGVHEECAFLAYTRNVRIWRTRGTCAFGAHEERAHLAHNDERAHLAYTRNVRFWRTRGMCAFGAHEECAHLAYRRNVRIWRTRGTCAFGAQR